MTSGYLWAPLLRRERPPGIGERSIGTVLVPIGGVPRVRVLPGNEDLAWAIDWIRAELAERARDPGGLGAWWKHRSTFTEDAVRLGPPAAGDAQDADAEIEAVYEELRGIG